MTALIAFNKCQHLFTTISKASLGDTFEPGVSGNDFWGFGNGKGIEKTHSRNLGTGRELKKNIPEIREREGN